jgi:hypothetical protein
MSVLGCKNAHVGHYNRNNRIITWGTPATQAFLHRRSPMHAYAAPILSKTPKKQASRRGPRRLAKQMSGVHHPILIPSWFDSASLNGGNRRSELAHRGGDRRFLWIVGVRNDRGGAARSVGFWGVGGRAGRHRQRGGGKRMTTWGDSGQPLLPYERRGPARCQRGARWLIVRPPTTVSG